MSAKGTEILLRARQQFRQMRTVETLKKIDVPEWSCTVHFWPVRDMEERLACEEHVILGKGSRTLSQLTALHATQVRVRARDEHGNRLFSDEDAAALADTQPKVIERISLEMGIQDGVTLEDAEKN